MCVGVGFVNFNNYFFFLQKQTIYIYIYINVRLPSEMYDLATNLWYFINFPINLGFVRIRCKFTQEAKNSVKFLQNFDETH
jgi:hypothetical protein